MVREKGEIMRDIRKWISEGRAVDNTTKRGVMKKNKRNLDDIISLSL